MVIPRDGSNRSSRSSISTWGDLVGSMANVTVALRYDALAACLLLPPSAAAAAGLSEDGQEQICPPNNTSSSSLSQHHHAIQIQVTTDRY
jgi:adiponectin receptor